MVMDAEEDFARNACRSGLYDGSPQAAPRAAAR